jgi:hypothetical protein
MQDLISSLMGLLWSHPLTLIGIVLCAVLYARIMMTGPREG